MEFDDIIVGGGSSGAVLAARLSEDGKRTVLLIEAGPDYADIAGTPARVLDGLRPERDHDWGFSAEMVPGRSMKYPRGKVIGGCSSVNACLALRGVPEDYDEWAALGNTEWSWDSVLPTFMRIEDDPGAAPEYHGVGGPTPIRRYTNPELWPAQSAFVAVCGKLGFPTVYDHNSPDATGVGSGTWNVRPDNIRASTAIAYLLPARSRPNLTIRSDCLVDRVVFDGLRAVGVAVRNRDGTQTFHGRRITLSGGSIGSPAIMLRSGIGPANELRALGIEPVASLNGVGKNLIEHTRIAVSWNSPPGIVEERTPYVQVLLRHTAPGSVLRNDMQIILFQPLTQPALSLTTLLVKPLSRGRLRLQSADPNIQPDIQLNLAQETEDRRRIREGLKLLANFVCQSELAALGSDTLILDDLQSLSATEFADSIRHDDWSDAYIHRSLRHYVHPVGTARMGSASDPDAVVDQSGRVHGVAGLRVVDASIMPTIPRANTHLSCVMIAERIGERMRKERD
jgi:choline dehydrogenase-like flavoprotein